MTDETESAADLKQAAEMIEKLRIGFLLDDEAINDGLAPVAREHAMIALALLEQACRHMRLADQWQAHALAASRR